MNNINPQEKKDLEGKILPVNFKNHHSRNYDIMKESDDHNGGGGDMEKFVKHYELEATKESILHQMEIDQLENKNSFNEIRKETINLKNSIASTIETELLKNNVRLAHEAKETRRYLIGTLIIGSLGVIAAFLAIFL